MSDFFVVRFINERQAREYNWQPLHYLRAKMGTEAGCYLVYMFGEWKNVNADLLYVC
jgi:hypothetical protein